MYGQTPRAFYDDKSNVVQDLILKCFVLEKNREE